ncbi:MAG: hypothetical protein ABIN55_05930 [Aeromicrobium sp.]
MPIRAHFIFISVLLVATAACGQTSPKSPDSDSVRLEHVHGLGINPADGSLYAGTHTGVYRITSDAAPVGPRQDTMGFTVLGANEFLASGHPADASQPNPLGLIESKDAGRSWKSVDFGGESDFHAIDNSGGTTYAYSSTSEELFRSSGTSGFSVIGRYPVYDIAADPREADRLLLTSDTGELKMLSGGKEPIPVPDAPVMGVIDFDDDGAAVGFGPDAEVYVSLDGGTRWKQVSTLSRPVEAALASTEGWFAATADGIVKSTDGGKTWVTYYRVES